MLSKEEWDTVLRSFEKSGLRQKAFCEANSLSHKQFLYRWNLRMRLRRQGKFSDFEPVLLANLPLGEKKELTLKIHLPNQLRCEVIILSTEVMGWIKELANVTSL